LPRRTTTTPQLVFLRENARFDTAIASLPAKGFRRQCYAELSPPDEPPRHIASERPLKTPESVFEDMTRLEDCAAENFSLALAHETT